MIRLDYLAVEIHHEPNDPHFGLLQIVCVMCKPERHLAAYSEAGWWYGRNEHRGWENDSEILERVVSHLLDVHRGLSTPRVAGAQLTAGMAGPFAGLMHLSV